MSGKRKYGEEVAGLVEESLTAVGLDASIDTLDDDCTISSESSSESSSSSDSSSSDDDSSDFLYEMALYSTTCHDHYDLQMLLLLMLFHQQGHSSQELRDALKAIMIFRLSRY